MSPHTFIFMGQSGSGKGEQNRLLQKVLKEKNPEREIYNLETGNNFRKLVSGDSYSSKLAKAVADKGKLQPAFLAVCFWADNLLNNIKGDEHWILDGICRRLEEATVFTTAVEFYDRKPIVIYVKVSRKWATDRLLGRGRADDTDMAQLNGRLDWFEEFTMPAIEYLKTNDRYTVLEINGEQTIEQVHEEIMQKLGW